VIEQEQEQNAHIFQRCCQAVMARDCSWLWTHSTTAQPQPHSIHREYDDVILLLFYSIGLVYNSIQKATTRNESTALSISFSSTP
jgi:hypothetical protein